MGTNPSNRGNTMSRRAAALADRLEQGAAAPITLAAGPSEEEWQVRIPGDGRKVGVIVHHVGNMYPIEVELAQALASGQANAGGGRGGGAAGQHRQRRKKEK